MEMDPPEEPEWKPFGFHSDDYDSATTVVPHPATDLLAKALKAFLHTCEYHKSPPMDKECGAPAVHYHAGYEGEIWWACKKHGTDKRFHWVGDFEVDQAQIAAREALAAWEGRR